MKELNHKVKDRLDKVKAKLPDDKKYLANYVRRNPKGFVEAIHCKGCGIEIQHLVPIDNLTTVERDGQKTTINHYMVMMVLPNYREVTIEMEDGSKHVTPFCQDCVDDLTNDMLEFLYVSDLAEWESDGVSIEAFVNRIPKKILKVE